MVDVAPGTYSVFSVVRAADSRPECATFGAIYSKAVPCGLDVTCTDHTPLPVTVRPGQVTGGVDPGDWYWNAPDNSFQAPPAGVVPAHSFVPTGGAFSSARAAA